MQVFRLTSPGPCSTRPAFAAAPSRSSAPSPQARFTKAEALLRYYRSRHADRDEADERPTVAVFLDDQPTFQRDVACADQQEITPGRHLTVHSLLYTGDRPPSLSATRVRAELESLALAYPEIRPLHAALPGPERREASAGSHPLWKRSRARSLSELGSARLSSEPRVTPLRKISRARSLPELGSARLSSEPRIIPSTTATRARASAEK